MARSIIVEWIARAAEHDAAMRSRKRSKAESMKVMALGVVVFATISLALGVIAMFNFGSDTLGPNSAKAETASTVPPPPTIPPRKLGPRSAMFAENPRIEMVFDLGYDGSRRANMQLSCIMFDESNPLAMYFEVDSPNMEADLRNSRWLARGSWDDVLVWASQDPRLSMMFGGPSHLWFELKDDLSVAEVEDFAGDLNRAVSDANPCA